MRQGKAKIAGQPAVRIDYQMKNPAGILEISIWCFIKNGFAYRIIRSEFASHVDQRAKDYKKILGSIKLLR